MHAKLSRDTNVEDEVPKYCLGTTGSKLFQEKCGGNLGEDKVSNLQSAT